MDINIYDDINTVTHKYYGTDVTPSTAEELWAQFCSKISTPTKEYLHITSSVNKEEVRKALANFVQGAIATMVAEGESPPEFTSPEVQSLIDTLKQKLVDLRGQPELDGLISTNKNVVYATLIALCGDLTLTQALTSLLTRAAATIAERGAALPTLYLDFLAKMVEAAKTSEATVALSPREDEIRRIMFEIFNLALEMIRVLQRSSILQSNLLYYYTNMQREYSTMMSKTPLYGPTPNQYIIANASDFGKTTLGQGNITIRNIAEYLVEQLGENTGRRDYSSQYSGDFAPVLNFVLTREADGGYFFEIQFWNSTIGYWTPLSTRKANADGTYFGADQPADPTHLYYASPSLTGTQQKADVVNQLMYHLTRQWNETPDSMGGPGGNIIYYYWEIPNPDDPDNPTPQSAAVQNFGLLKYYWSPSANAHWMYNIYFTGPIGKAYANETPIPPDASADEKKKIEEANTKARQEASTFRSEVNSQLQIYMENARALKDMAKEAAKRSESVLTQLKEAVQNQSNFLSAITECLRGMLSAIFR